MSEKFSLVETSQDPIISPSLHLPAEILSLILSWILPPLVRQSWTPDAWSEFINVLLSCCLVSKAWCEAASEILYKCIRLSQLESFGLLLRTVRSESFGGYCPALALHFKPQYTPHPLEEQKFAILAGEIVVCSPKLLYLTGDRGPLYFTSTMSHPKYPCLTMLKVSGQDLQLLAPLLPHLCNLKAFELLQSHGDSDILNLSFVPPSFKLTKLSICQTELSPGLCKWLFASTSESLEFLEVQNVSGADLRHLIEVIGGSVKELYIKRMVWNIKVTDSEAIKVLSGLAGLRRLHIDGWRLEREHLLNLQSSLETFAISSNFARDVEILLRSGWQPSLQSVDMYVEPVPSFLGVLQPERDMPQRRYKLAQTCAARGIQLNEKFCT